jgi:rSAM/selenodomain-associated transferase 1
MKDKALIIFRKNFELGTVKTRVAKDIGDQQAMELYKWLVERTQQQVDAVDADKYIFFSNRCENVKNGHYTDVQEGAGLGERMKNSFRKLFDLGYNKIVIIGTDCPELTGQIIRDAFQALDDQEFVIGPAYDGGYYLLGMRQYSDVPFDGMNYSHDQVYDQTIERIGKHRLAILPVLRDVDQLDDLKYLGLFDEVQGKLNLN